MKKWKRGGGDNEKFVRMWTGAVDRLAAAVMENAKARREHTKALRDQTKLARSSIGRALGLAEAMGPIARKRKKKKT